MYFHCGQYSRLGTDYWLSNLHTCKGTFFPRDFQYFWQNLYSIHFYTNTGTTSTERNVVPILSWILRPLWHTKNRSKSLSVDICVFWIFGCKIVDSLLFRDEGLDNNLKTGDWFVGLFFRNCTWDLRGWGVCFGRWRTDGLISVVWWMWVWFWWRDFHFFVLVLERLDYDVWLHWKNVLGWMTDRQTDRQYDSSTVV